MKLKLEHLFFIVLLGTAFSMNPTWTDHKKRVLEGQTHLDLQPDLDFVRNCDFYDYKVFSLMFYRDKLISVGVLGNVHIRYAELNYCMISFQEIRSLSGFDPPQF
jgi:hypothetical protein